MKEKIKTLYLDPPWKICTGGTSVRKKTGEVHNVWGTPQNHYAVLSIKDMKEEIAWVKDELADDAHIYMWVVNNLIPEALDILEFLGFKYITNLVWVKDRFGMGQYFRGQHELLFFGRKGKPMPYKKNEETGKKYTISTFHQEKRSEHSRKPHYFYDVIEAISYPPFLEMFARNERDGWSSWGNEIDKY